MDFLVLVFYLFPHWGVEFFVCLFVAIQLSSTFWMSLMIHLANICRQDGSIRHKICTSWLDCNSRRHPSSVFTETPTSRLVPVWLLGPTNITPMACSQYQAGWGFLQKLIHTLPHSSVEISHPNPWLNSFLRNASISFCWRDPNNYRYLSLFQDFLGS